MVHGCLDPGKVKFTVTLSFDFVCGDFATPDDGRAELVRQLRLAEIALREQLANRELPVAEAAVVP